METDNNNNSMLLLKRLAFMFSGNTRPTLSLRRTWRLLGCFWRTTTRSKLKHSSTEHRCCRTKQKTKNCKSTTKFALFYSWTVVIVWHAWTCNCTQYRCVTLEFLIIGGGLLRQLSATTSCLLNLRLPRKSEWALCERLSSAPSWHQQVRYWLHWLLWRHVFEHQMFGFRTGKISNACNSV